MLKIGLTGGIGSGKTTITNLFSTYNIPIIDADIIAREVTAPSQPALQKISKLFGNLLIDDNGQLNRKLLRDIIFNDPNKRHQLEAILHPLIRQRMLELVEVANQRKIPYCILSIPLLLESGWSPLLDRVIVIDIDGETQLQRTIQRDNIDRESAKAIINTQASQQERLSIADEVINNSGGLDDLQRQIQQLHQKYQKISND